MWHDLQYCAMRCYVFAMLLHAEADTPYLGFIFIFSTINRKHRLLHNPLQAQQACKQLQCAFRTMACLLNGGAYHQSLRAKLRQLRVKGPTSFMDSTSVSLQVCWAG